MTERGFTLIELMIAVAIIAILASVAYPTYIEHIRKTRRAEIATALIEEAHKLERFYSKVAQYSDSQGPPAREHVVGRGNEFYVIDAERWEQAFVLTATPISGALMGDDMCGGFVLQHTGKRDNVGMSGDASVDRCWGR